MKSALKSRKQCKKEKRCNKVKVCNKVENSAFMSYFIPHFLAENGAVLMI
jgi:hypothetical protein